MEYYIYEPKLLVLLPIRCNCLCYKKMWQIIKGPSLKFLGLLVVYFNQRLGDAHSKGWSAFVVQKSLKKARNLQQILAINCFFLFAPECWYNVLFPKKKKLAHFCGIEQSTSILVQFKKTCFLL